MNLLALPALVAMESTADALRRNGASRVIADLLDSGCTAILLWAAVGWPLVSFSALLYTLVVDRQTRWWRTKVVAAVIMLPVGLIACAGLFWFYRYTEQ